ncbi:MAG: SRPBCC family protein [Ktedonobacterales bacterium]
MIIEGTSEAVAKVEVATAFAFLADPHNGRFWFASAAPVEPLSGLLAEGNTWHLEKTKQTRRVLPLRMVAYDPPDRFVWATELGGLATNNIWELRFQPGPEDGTTRLTMTLRLRLGPFGWLSALVAAGRLRRTLGMRAERALVRACEILEAEQQVIGAVKSGKQGRGAKPSRSRRRRDLLRER